MSPAKSRDPRQVVEHWMPEVYVELRERAAALMRGERRNHTLQPTALVHEAFLKLSRQARLEVNDRRHFCAVAALAMRQVLVERARAHRAGKRGGGWLRVTLAEGIVEEPERGEDMLALGAALDALGREDELAARIVIWSYFGGLTHEEIAVELGRSDRWVRGQLSHARAWLKREMAKE